MTEGREFEPTLGRISDKAYRPRSQLKKLAHLARQGEPRTFARRRFAPWEIASRNRGGGAAATASLWADVNRRRVWLRITIGLAHGANTGAFASHLKYIQRDGTDQDGSRAKLFDRNTEDISSKSFEARSREDGHQFRILVSPEDAGRMEDLRAFARKLMNQVERDLGGSVDWVATCHYNTGQPHVHIVVRGGNARDGETFIAKKYLTQGMRYRAEALVTQELGNRTWRELSVNRRLEVLAERFTSIDAGLSLKERGGSITLATSAESAAQPNWLAKLYRLRQLRRLGLAEHVHAAHWRLAEGWTDTLKSIGPRTAALEALQRGLGDRFNLRAVEDPASGSIGGWITGRLGAISDAPGEGAGALIALEGLDGRTWMFQVPEHEMPGLPETGAVISVYRPALQPGRALTGKTSAGSDAAAPSLSLPSLSVHSWLPVEGLAQRRAFTWLDELSADSVGGLSAGFGADVRAAWQARQAFLQSAGLGQMSREDLQAAELGDIAADEARKLQKRFAALGRREIFRGVFANHVDTAQGRFALIEGERRFTLVPQTEDMAPLKGQSVTVERSALLRRGGIAGGRGIER